MFLDVLAYVAQEIVIIDQMNAASIAHADAICGVQIADVNAWVCRYWSTLLFSPFFRW